jgi:uncharacterized protein YbjT (DUF2867 family)
MIGFMANKTVLVVGASGQTGRLAVKALRRHGFEVRALIRSESSRAELEADGVQVVIGDVTREEDARSAMAGVQAVVSTLGSKGPMTDKAHIELIEFTTMAGLAILAKDAGVGHFVMCSSMGVEIPDMVPPLAEILRQKRRGELALEGSGVPFTIVRPGGLIDEAGGGPIAIARTLHGFGTIPRADVAEVLAQALLQPAAINKIVEIISDPNGVPANAANLFALVANTQA